MNRSTLIVVAALAALAGTGVAAQEPTAAPMAQEHTVVDGNTLWGLAGSYYGDPWAWPTIYEANRGQLWSPDFLLPGWVLVIPGQPGSERRPPPMRTDEEPGQLAPADVGAISISGEGDTLRRRMDTDVEPVYADTQGKTAFYKENDGGFAVGSGMAREPLRAVPTQIANSAPFVVRPGASMPMLGILHPPSGVVPAGQLRYSARVYDRLVMEMAADAAAPAAGAHLQVYRVARDEPGLGRIARVTGVVRVEGPVEGGMRVQVVEQYDRMQDGDRVRMLPPNPTDAPAGAAAVQGGAEYRIAAVDDSQPIQGPGDWVFVDVGDAPPLRPGDELVVEADPALPPQARLQVVSVHDGLASLRIVQLSSVVVDTGARLRLDRRLR